MQRQSSVVDEDFDETERRTTTTDDDDGRRQRRHVRYVGPLRHSRAVVIDTWRCRDKQATSHTSR